MPRFNPQKWDFRVLGVVEEPLRFSYAGVPGVAAEPPTVADFHCVTTWSRLDNLWEGVAGRGPDDAGQAQARRRASSSIHCDGGYTTNLPLDEFVDDDVMLAYRHDGQRPRVPTMAGRCAWWCRSSTRWKSAKWVRAIEFLARDRRGFWEVRGYHNHADPWTEERYSFQEDPED